MMEDYVSFEQAKTLKELGFDWECNHWFHPLELYKVLESVSYCNHNRFTRPYSAPTLAQTQKWLREVKGIALNILAHDGGGYHWESIFLPVGPEFGDFIGPDNNLYDTYELALSAGIDKALELLKEESKSL